MGLFFNRDASKTALNTNTNSYLDDQKSLFNTKDNSQKKVVDDSYDDYVYKPKDYSNVPKYKARDLKKVDIVVDQNDFGYEELNPDIKTVNLQKKDLHEDLMELVNNEYIDEKNKVNTTSIYDEGINNEIKKDDNIEIIDIDDDKTIPDISASKVENLNNSKKLSIFGSSDEPIKAKIHEITPEDLKPKEVVVEKKEEPKEEVKINEDGKKVCPNCGAPLSLTATTCFLCGTKL